MNNTQISDDAIRNQRAFEQAYVFAEPYSRFVNGCSLQTTSFLEGLHRDLALDRPPQDLCFYVFLERKLPNGMDYPREFLDIPVVTRVIGEIHDTEPVYEDTHETQ